MVAAPASQTVSMNNLIRAQYGSGKLSLPLEGGLSYIGFEHVQGVRSFGQTEGFSIYRLKLLDSMIERLQAGMADKLASKELESVVETLTTNPEVTAEAVDPVQIGQSAPVLLDAVV